MNDRVADTVSILPSLRLFARIGDKEIENRVTYGSGLGFKRVYIDRRECAYMLGYYSVTRSAVIPFGLLIIIGSTTVF
ncbi:hypothetical protein WN48_06281 [Eufriesea mexicana]|nr:hypothetical protein WN48_06281 [Eufriesea mexicana]